MRKLLIPLCLILASLSACRYTGQAQGQSDAIPLQITPAITRIIIDSLGHVLYNNYVFPDTAQKWASYIKMQYEMGAYAVDRRAKVP